MPRPCLPTTLSSCRKGRASRRRPGRPQRTWAASLVLGGVRSGPAPPRRQPGQRVPLYGALDVPSGEDDGPPNGLTLDMAIDRLAQANYGLRTRFQEIPKAQADILSAGLRGNPLVFASVDGVPYGN